MGQIKLDCPVSRRSQPEVIKSLYWVDAGLASLEFDAGDEQVIHYRLQGETKPPDLARRLKAAGDRLARSVKMLPSKTFYESTHFNPPGARAPYEQLVKRGWVRPVANGAHVYGGLMSELYHAFDAELLREALGMGLAEYKFPSVMEVAALARGGYLESFPHHLNFLCHLPEQMEVVERFKARVASAGPSECGSFHQDMPAPEAAMAPAVCYHFYHINEGRVLRDGMISGTAVSPCYRYEGKPTTGLRRLREFTMREFMFIGSAEEILAQRETLLKSMIRMLELSELKSVLQTASDPFFVDVYDKQRVYQMSFDLKYEAQAYLTDDDVWLAIGSVNYHQDHFGKAFDITLPSGEPAHSGCMAFGVDRWCLAVFAQYGLDPATWPAGLQALLTDYRESRARRPVTEGVG